MMSTPPSLLSPSAFPISPLAYDPSPSPCHEAGSLTSPPSSTRNGRDQTCGGRWPKTWGMQPQPAQTPSPTSMQSRRHAEYLPQSPPQPQLSPPRQQDRSKQNRRNLSLRIQPDDLDSLSTVPLESHRAQMHHFLHLRLWMSRFILLESSTLEIYASESAHAQAQRPLERMKMEDVQIQRLSKPGDRSIAIFHRSKRRWIVLACSSEQCEDWMTALEKARDRANSHSLPASTLSIRSPPKSPTAVPLMNRCLDCSGKIGIFKRKYECAFCQHAFCEKCCSGRRIIPGDSECSRVCTPCLRFLTRVSWDEEVEEESLCCTPEEEVYVESPQMAIHPPMGIPPRLSISSPTLSTATTLSPPPSDRSDRDWSPIPTPNHLSSPASLPAFLAPLSPPIDLHVPHRCAPSSRASLTPVPVHSSDIAALSSSSTPQIVPVSMVMPSAIPSALASASPGGSEPRCSPAPNVGSRRRATMDGSTPPCGVLTPSPDAAFRHTPSPAPATSRRLQHLVETKHGPAARKQLMRIAKQLGVTFTLKRRFSLMKPRCKSVPSTAAPTSKSQKEPADDRCMAACTIM